MSYRRATDVAESAHDLSIAREMRAVTERDEAQVGAARLRAAARRGELAESTLDECEGYDLRGNRPGWYVTCERCYQRSCIGEKLPAEREDLRIIHEPGCEYAALASDAGRTWLEERERVRVAAREAWALWCNGDMKAAGDLVWSIAAGEQQ